MEHERRTLLFLESFPFIAKIVVLMFVIILSLLDFNSKTKCE